MNELKIMNIGGVDCYEKDGTAYLKLEAVARGLGFIQKKNGVEYVKWERVNGYLSDLGFSPEVGKPVFIPENIFYRLAMKAKNAAAEAFQAKVADEIIPSIRKTGGYIAGQENMTDVELMARALLVAQKQIEERDKQIEGMKPKVLFAQAVETSKQSILVGDLAKLLKQNGVDMGSHRLFRWLRDNEYLIKRGESRNMPTQYSMERGIMEVKESTTAMPDGAIRITLTPKITGKGQTYFVNKFLSEKVS